MWWGVVCGGGGVVGAGGAAKAHTRARTPDNSAVMIFYASAMNVPSMRMVTYALEMPVADAWYLSSKSF